MFDLLIVGGTIVDGAQRFFGDVAVKDGTSVDGVVTRHEWVETAARPGRLVRGGR